MSSQLPEGMQAALGRSAEALVPAFVHRVRAKERPARLGRDWPIAMRASYLRSTQGRPFIDAAGPVGGGHRSAASRAETSVEAVVDTRSIPRRAPGPDAGSP